MRRHFFYVLSRVKVPLSDIEIILSKFESRVECVWIARETETRIGFIILLIGMHNFSFFATEKKMWNERPAKINPREIYNHSKFKNHIARKFKWQKKKTRKKLLTCNSITTYTEQCIGECSFTGRLQITLFQHISCSSLSRHFKRFILFTRDDVFTSVLNSGAHSFRILGSQKLPCLFNFPVSRARPEKKCVIFIGCNFESRAIQVGLHKQNKDTASEKKGEVSLKNRWINTGVTFLC